MDEAIIFNLVFRSEDSPSADCEGCAFFGQEQMQVSGCHKAPCMPYERYDNKHVIWKLATE